jgi:hypothetical protein
MLDARWHKRKNIMAQKENTMTEKAIAESKGRRELTKPQAISVMIIGGLMLALPMIISTEVGTNAHTAKIIVGFLGACILIAGAYLRPMESAAGRK